MAKIKVHGGDFVAGESGKFSFGVLTLPTPNSFLGIFTGSEKIPLSKVMRVQAVNKETRHRTGAAVGRGLVGGMLGGLVSGPVGLTSAVIGFTMTNHTSDVMFEAEFEGGRRLLATTNTTTYSKLLAAAFDYKPPQDRGEPSRPVAPRPHPFTDLGTALAESRRHTQDSRATAPTRMMDKELPPKIWVPILATCALIPLALFKLHIVSVIVALGVLGVVGYLAVRATRAERNGRAFGYVFAALFVIGFIVNAITPAPTLPDNDATTPKVAAQATTPKVAAQAKPQSNANDDQASGDCALTALFGGSYTDCLEIEEPNNGDDGNN
jgi:hypothetical protein